MGHVLSSAATTTSSALNSSNSSAGDVLQRFTQTLLNSGDLLALGTDAVTVYLVARHHFQSSAGKRFPSAATLSKIVGIDKERVTQALQALQQRGYLQGKDGRYVLREKSCITHEDQQTTEVTWDIVNPGSLLNIREFRKVLVSGELGDARILHIEHLQVNINNIQEGGIGVNSQPVHTSATDHDAAELVSMLRPKEMLVAEPEPIVPVPAANTVAPAPVVAVSNAVVPPPVPIEPKVLPVVAEAVAAPAVVAEPAIPKPVAVPLTEQYQALRKQYVAEAYEAHVQALELAESVADKAFRELLLHEAQRPRKPSSWMMLFQQYSWESKDEAWQQRKLALQTEYDQVAAERQRLMKALHLNHGVVPAYEQAALAKLQLGYPELCAAMEAA